MNPHVPHAPLGPTCPAGPLSALHALYSRSTRSKRSIHAPEPSQIAPERLSDLAPSHSSPSSHHPKSLILAPKSQVTPSSLTEGTNVTLTPRRAALSALAHSSDLSDRSRTLE